MPVEIIIRNETPEGVMDHIRALAANFDHRPVPAPAEPAPKLAVSEIAKEAINQVAGAKAADVPARRGRKSNAEKAAEAAAQQISTQPENRVDPEVDAQDEADEAAESGEGFDLGETTKPIVRDDVRALAVAYQTKYGTAAVQEDGKKIFGFSKISEIPDDKLAEAHASMWNAIENNPYKRAVVGSSS